MNYKGVSALTIALTVCAPPDVASVAEVNRLKNTMALRFEAELCF